MQKNVKVKFDTHEMAERVRELLHYDVELDDIFLIFSNFDKVAFEAAVALEGLNRKDYSYVGGGESTDLGIYGLATCTSTRYTFTRPCRLVSLEFSLRLFDGSLQKFSLAVDYSEFPMRRLSRFDEFPLRLDSVSLEFARLLQHYEMCDRTKIVSVVEMMYVRADKRNNPCRYYLIINGEIRSNAIEFYPIGTCVTVS